MSGRTIPPELIRSALSHIPADLPCDAWARVGMTIKSALSGDDGLELFDACSCSNLDAYTASHEHG